MLAPVSADELVTRACSPSIQIVVRLHADAAPDDTTPANCLSEAVVVRSAFWRSQCRMMFLRYGLLGRRQGQSIIVTRLTSASVVRPSATARNATLLIGMKPPS